MKSQKEMCGATCPDQRGGPDFVCELKKDHKGKHDSAPGGFWTDLGAERLRQEIAAKAKGERR